MDGRSSRLPEPIQVLLLRSAQRGAIRIAHLLEERQRARLGARPRPTTPLVRRLADRGGVAESLASYTTETFSELFWFVPILAA